MLGFQTESGMSRPSKTEGVYVQSIPRQKGLCPDFPALNKFLCFHMQAFVSSPDFCALLVRLSCFHVQYLRNLPDLSAYAIFRPFISLVILDTGNLFRAFILGLDILDSAWHLNMGCIRALIFLTNRWRISEPEIEGVHIAQKIAFEKIFEERKKLG